jgi:hypothetical protein
VHPGVFELEKGQIDKLKNTLSDEERIGRRSVFDPLCEIDRAADPRFVAAELGEFAEMAANAERHFHHAIHREQRSPPLFPDGNELKTEMHRRIGRLEQKKMTVAGELLMAPAVGRLSTAPDSDIRR